MAEIFLGEPPANIKQWIIDHYAAPIARATTIITTEEDGA